MTGSRNGTITLWKDKQIEKSIKIYYSWTLVQFKRSRIFAASQNTDVAELSMNLELVKTYKGRDHQALTIDANESFLVIGYISGFVDVHDRRRFDINGTHQKRTVKIN